MKKKTGLSLLLAAVLLLSGLGFQPEAAIKSRGEYLLPNSSDEYLGWEDVEDLTVPQLRIARNEIYAREGYSFGKPEIARYFNYKNWYHPVPNFSESYLNVYESYNVQLIVEEENRRGGPVTIYWND